MFHVIVIVKPKTTLLLLLLNFFFFDWFLSRYYVYFPFVMIFCRLIFLLFSCVFTRLHGCLGLAITTLHLEFFIRSLASTSLVIRSKQALNIVKYYYKPLLSIIAVNTFRNSGSLSFFFLLRARYLFVCDIIEWQILVLICVSSSCSWFLESLWYLTWVSVQ